jgi:hypothetical protein
MIRYRKSDSPIQRGRVFLDNLRQFVHCRLNQMFEQRRMYKTYIAWVHGEIAADRGVIDMPLPGTLAWRVHVAITGFDAQ